MTSGRRVAVSVLTAAALMGSTIAPALAATSPSPSPSESANALPQGATVQKAPLTDKPVLQHHTKHKAKDLSGADLSGSVAHHSDFRKVTLHHSQMQSGTFHHSKFDGVSMHHVTAHHSDFSNSSMPAIIAHASDFRFSNFFGTDLRKAKLDGSKAHYADFTGAKLHDASMRGLKAHNAIFVDAKLHRSDLTGAVIHTGDFTRVVMPGATLRKATAHHTTFISANLNKADLRGADLSNSNFSSGKGNLRSSAAVGPHSTTMTGSNASNSNLSGSNLSGVDMTGANLSNADLSNANLSNANLSNANISGTDFSGANMSGTTMPSGSAAASVLCTSSKSMTGVSIGNGLTASFTPSSRGSGTVQVNGPNGVILTGTYSCSSSAWTITVSGGTGTFNAPVPGLSVSINQASGTISQSLSKSPVWSVNIPFTLTKSVGTSGSFSASGSMAVSGTDSWQLKVSAGSLPAGMTDVDGSAITANGFSGTVSYSSGNVSGSIVVGLVGPMSSQIEVLKTLPSGWHASTALSLDFAKAPTDANTSETLNVSIMAASSTNADSITFSGQWSPAGYALAASGSFTINGVATAVTGGYESIGYVDNNVPLTKAKWSVSASVSNVTIGSGASISGTLSVSSSTPGISGTVNLKPVATQDFSLVATMNYVSSSSWTLTLTGQSSSNSWSPSSVPGLSVNPNNISGTITTDATGTAWNVTLAGITWNSTKAGISMSTTATLTSTCPLTGVNCGTSTGPYFGFVNASLTFPSPMGTVTAQGALQLDGKWGYVQANPGNFTVNGPGGSSIGLKNSSVVLWLGSKPTSAVASVSLPDISSLSDGIGVEFCGTFNASIPGFTTVDTGGCVDYTSAGIIIGQTNSSLATLPSSSDGTITTNGGSLQGWLWSNLPTTSINGLPSASASLAGRSLGLLSKVSQFTGNIGLPGAVMNAMGKPAVDATIPATLTFAYNGSFSDSDFSLAATVDISMTSGGFTLSSLTFVMSKSGSNYSLSLNANAYATLDGKTYALKASFAASTGGGFTLSFTAQGTGPCGASCDGVNTPLANPQTGYTYLTDSYFGLKGLHLWSLRASIGYDKGSPQVGIGSTTYLDPTQVPGFVGTTWLQGSSNLNISYTSPCFSYGFNSTDPKTYMQIEGGVFSIHQFAVAIAPTGCNVAGVQIPAGVSINFAAGLGNATASVYMMLGKDSSGNPTFTSDTSMSNVSWAGITYNQMDLDISITTTSQSVSFDGLMTLPVGTVYGDFDLSINETSGAIQLSGDVCVNTTGCQSGTNYTMDGGDLAVNSFQFHMDLDTSVGSFTASTGGYLAIKSKSYKFTGSIQISNGVLQDLSFDYTYTHGGSNWNFELDYDSKTGYISGSMSWSYTKETSKKISTYKYVRHADISLSMTFSMDTKNPSSATMTFTGTMSGSDISGSVTCTLTASGDDSASASISIHKNSTVKWSDSWSW